MIVFVALDRAEIPWLMQWIDVPNDAWVAVGFEMIENWAIGFDLDEINPFYYKI